MRKTLARIRKLGRRNDSEESSNHKVKDRVVLIGSGFVVIGIVWALARVPWLQLDPPKAVPSAKIASAAPVAVKPVAVVPVRLCLDNPKRPPPCAGIGRR